MILKLPYMCICPMCREQLTNDEENGRGICDACYWDALETEAYAEALLEED